MRGIVLKSGMSLKTFGYSSRANLIVQGKLVSYIDCSLPCRKFAMAESIRAFFLIRLKLPFPDRFGRYVAVLEALLKVG
jgi:hypothetical protein